MTVKRFMIILMIAIVVALVLDIIHTNSNHDPFDGNSYKFDSEDSTKMYIVKFSNDSMEYMMHDLSNEEKVKKGFIYHYEVIPMNDSICSIVPEFKPDWWETRVWDVVKTDYGIRSVRTGNKYYLVK